MRSNPKSVPDSSGAHLEERSVSSHACPTYGGCGRAPAPAASLVRLRPAAVVLVPPVSGGQGLPALAVASPSPSPGPAARARARGAGAGPRAAQHGRLPHTLDDHLARRLHPRLAVRVHGQRARDLEGERGGGERR